jgi:putative ABC transport system permease protein
VKIIRLTLHAARTLRSQPIMTALVVACVAVGVAAFVTVLAMSRGMENQVRKIMEGFGPRSMMVIPSKTAGPNGIRPFWTPAQIDALRSAVGDRAIVSTYKLKSDETVKADSTTTVTSVYAVDLWLPELEDRDCEEGSPLSPDDGRQLARVCVVGPSLAKKLFGSGDPVGQTVLIRNERFTVKGLAAKRGVSPLGMDMDDFVWIPLMTGVKRLFRDDQFRVIRLRTEVGVDPKSFTSDLTAQLRDLHHLAPGQPNDFRIIASEQAEQRHRDATASARRAGWILSIVSLALGGMILTNTLLLSVNQRRSEFGLKRALGAKAGAIFLELVLESLLICIFGLMAGALLGVAATAVLLRVLPHTPAALSWQAFAFAAAISCILGILAGCLPGRSAVRIEPATALR